jgi:glycosyltransferase involved in cell wall biosynthesis
MKYYRSCSYLVANTPGVVRHVVEAGWPADRVGMVSNFGEVPDRSRARDLREELSIPGGAKVLLSMGRLHGNKAHDVALRALARLPEGVLLLAGTGAMREGLQRLAEELGVKGRVRFLGWRRDVENLYETADLCLFPSRAEPLGNVVLEAWAFGVPIVAAASEGPSWLIDDGVNGLLFPVDEVESAVAAVRRLLDDDDLRERLVRGGGAKLAAEFSRDVIVGKYRDLFAMLTSVR